MEKKLQKYLTDYNLLTEQDLWQVYYQILSILFLYEFIKLTVNKYTMMKNVKFAELNINIATALLTIQTLKMI